MARFRLSGMESNTGLILGIPCCRHCLRASKQIADFFSRCFAGSSVAGRLRGRKIARLVVALFNQSIGRSNFLITRCYAVAAE
jgi:hypothetical protein